MKKIRQYFVKNCKLLKSKSAKPYAEELTVFINVKIDNLKELSKSKLSINKILLKIKRLKKNKINTKKVILIFSLLIFLSEIIIFESKITLGLTSR